MGYQRPPHIQEVFNRALEWERDPGLQDRDAVLDRKSLKDYAKDLEVQLHSSSKALEAAKKRWDRIEEAEKRENTEALIKFEELRKAAEKWIEDNELPFHVVEVCHSHVSLVPNSKELEDEDAIVLLNTSAGWVPFSWMEDVTDCFYLDEVGVRYTPKHVLRRAEEDEES